MTRHNAHGTLLKMSDMAGTPTFTTIAQIIRVAGPNMTRGTTEAVDHDSTTAKDFLPDALYDGGEVTFVIHYDPPAATHNAAAGLKKALKDGDIRDFQLIYPDPGAAQDAFSAYVTAFGGEAESNNGKLMANVTLKVSGAITEAL
ncbi:MAG: hypothetical protein AMXMBFR53_29930 [Gemmatimonadota bacterium]